MWGWGGCFQQKICSISETLGQDKTKVASITNRKLHTRLRLVPKSTNLDDLEMPFYVFRSLPEKV